MILIDWLKELFNKMVPRKTVEKVFNVQPVISDKMNNAIKLWSAMYVGESPWLKNPTYADPERIISLNLPAMIASEKARMACIEMKSTITPKGVGKKVVGDKGNPSISAKSGLTLEEEQTPRTEFLNKQYKNLLSNIRRQLEYGIAKGSLVIKPYVVNRNGKPYKIDFDFVHADRFYPLSFEANNTITEAAFIQTKVDRMNQRVYTRVEHHKIVENGVLIENLAFESQNMSLAEIDTFSETLNLGKEIPLSTVAEWANLEKSTIVENVDKLLFAYFRMPEANTIDPYSPLGVSGYSRAIDLIRDADEQYSRTLWEFEAGEMAIDIDRDALKITQGADGLDHSINPRKQNRLFRKIDLNSEETYNVFAPELRDASLFNGLNNILIRIEDTVGLSRGTLSNIDTTEAKTATELRILKQRSYATNADIQAALQETLEDVVDIMNIYCDIYNITESGEYEVSFEWDDSILVDHESELAKRMTLQQNGIASKLENRMWYFGETEAQALAALERVVAEAEETMKRQMEINASLGMQTKAGGDTHTQNKGTGKQADSLNHPTKNSQAD